MFRTSKCSSSRTIVYAVLGIIIIIIIVIVIKEIP